MARVHKLTFEEWCDAKADHIADTWIGWEEWWDAPKTRMALTVLAIVLFLLVLESMLFYG